MIHLFSFGYLQIRYMEKISLGQLKMLSSTFKLKSKDYMVFGSFYIYSVFYY